MNNANVKNDFDLQWPQERTITYMYGADAVELFNQALQFARAGQKPIILTMGNFSYAVLPQAGEGEAEKFAEMLQQSSAYQRAERQYQLEMKRGELYLDQHFDDMKSAIESGIAPTIAWLLRLNELYQYYGHEFAIDARYIAKQLRQNGYKTSTQSLENIQQMPQNIKTRHFVEYAMKSLKKDFHGLPQALVAEMRQVLDLNLAKENTEGVGETTSSFCVRSRVQKGAVPTPRTLAFG